MNSRALDDMTRTDVLAFVESCHAHRSAAERNLLKAAYRWAVLHNPELASPFSVRARDRARPAGAVGTPLITEYSAAAFGARIQMSPYGAKKLIADAVDLHHRLPKLNAGICAGSVLVGSARLVAQVTRELSADEAGWVDNEVHEVADGRLAWSRFEALVEGKVAAASPELARAKELAEAKERFIRIGRVNKHGIATMTIRDHVTTLMATDTALTAVAQTLEAQMPDAGKGDRRLAALALLTNPDAHVDPNIGPIKPKVVITLHLTPDSPIARMEGHGPVTTAWVGHLIAHIAGKVKVAPVIDLANQTPVDAYEIPSAMREAVHLIHGGDVFPYAPNTGRRMDLDHTQPYGRGGRTEAGNLGPMTRSHHRIKTHAGWECRQPFPGIVLWRDPYGATYLVDHTGTRRVTGNTPRGPGGEIRPPLRITFKELLDGYHAA